MVGGCSPPNSSSRKELKVIPQVLLTTLYIVFGAIVFVVALIGIYKGMYRKVGPNEVLVISGRKGDYVEDGHGERHRLGFRIVKGGGSLVHPILERVEVMSLELITLDIVTP